MVPFMAAAVSCAGPQVLPRDNWNPEVYEALCGLMADYGVASEEYDRECRPYAVFDFDNTTIMNDITMTLMIYQAENLRYAFSPEEAFSVFSSWLPDLDVELAGVGMSAGEICRDLAEGYRVLKSMKDRGLSLREIHGSTAWLDFRAKLFALNDGIENTFDYADWCLWSPALFGGMTYDGLRELTRESVSYWMSFGKIWTERWDSPDGKVSVDVMKGLAVPQESVHLYKALEDNGFDVYICSASLEAVVEAMACSPEYGLGLPPDRVYGIRLQDKEKIGGEFDDGYDQTFLEGKTACIRRLIAPSHGGMAPSLVAGDSSGDYDMLTAFPSLKVGLIIDCGRGGLMSDLIGKASMPAGEGAVRYVVQGRDLSLPGYVR